MATTDELANAYDENSRQKQINDIYDAQKNAQLSELEGAYQRSRSNYEEEAAKIPGLYQQQKNDLAAQYERQRRSFNENAAVSGINSGTGSQAALSMNSGYQQNFGALGKAQADAQATASRTLADLEAQYRSAVASAISTNDYNRATSLLSAFESDRADAENAAKTKAAYGDFSGYAALYGDETAEYMRSVWVAQNPDLAFNTGSISAQEYRSMTGKWPKGFSSAATPRNNNVDVFRQEIAQMLSDGAKDEVINSAIIRAMAAGDISAEEAKGLLIVRRG